MIAALLEQGFAWTGDRVARVGPGDLNAATPCEEWSLRELLNHLLASLGRLAAAAEGQAAPPARDRLGDDCGRSAFADLRDHAFAVWRTPGVMKRTCELPLGSIPAPMAARLNLVEVVVHGWDVSQATGECADIPDALAEPILDFSRGAVGPARGRAFGPDLSTGESLSDRTVSFLGRRP